MSSRPQPPQPSPRSPAPHEGARRSHALTALTRYLESQESLQVIDLGGINQANLDYVTGMGHRLYAEDLLRSYDAFFSEEERVSRQIEPQRIEEFLDQSLDFADQSADAALVWDTLQFLPAPLAQAILDRLYRVMAPDGAVLAFFHPEGGQPLASPHVCRILDGQNMLLTPRPAQRPTEPFNTRSIERFFQRFASVKFFLTRENLQEVIARR
jgi:hypothetical protein